MDNHTIKTVFKEYIHPIEQKVIQKMIDQTEIDKYVKKLDTLKYLYLFIYAQLKGIKSLERMSELVTRKKTVQRLAGLESISKSQLSRKNRSIAPELFQVILHHLIQELHQVMGSKKAAKALGKLLLIDSSTISMCLKGDEWADFRETKAGVKIHTCVAFDGEESYPNDVILTPARPADETQLDALITMDKKVLHVFDRGYFNFVKYDIYCENGIRFVTRIKSNTIIHVTEELPVAPSSPITRHAVVKIGTMRNPLQLVETVDSEGNKISIVCNDAKVSAEEIGDLYRNRWQIELFFKWIKQHLVLKKLYGKGKNAVYNQIYIAMITYCLTLLMKKRIGFSGTLLEMLNWIGDFWSKEMTSFMAELSKESERSCKRRRRPENQPIFEETLLRHSSVETLHLDDLTYELTFFN